ncbi:STAS domain-containing protein [Streptomyces sp. TRM66268-LWL]|uniref:STAS domain-containing protein n=1 Tax=Streptomyces polyasparticus TaxID=2767826 RepID=A0ABR7SL61_9ACTN|nr:STAS domain-containing protein [Streptomyces polyasparticus]MBC9715088.1 STAS domain-containing protein [Streptomyces polyasparticus]
MPTPSEQPHLTITELAWGEDSAVLRVSGELDQSGEEFFLRTLGAVIEAGRHHVVLDVTALVFCDSRGLNCLLAISWLLQRRQGLLLLAGVGRRLAVLLAGTGSAEVLPMHSSVGRALEALPPHHRPPWPPLRPDGGGRLDTG